jgi:hypothetical protein
MSIIDTAAHTVQSYDPKTSKAFTGQRLAKFAWKTVTDKLDPMCGIKRDSKCVSLPVVTGQEILGNIEALVPHVQNYLHSVQDKMIREMLEASNNVLHVTQESISLASVCAWLEENDESGRLTKDSVGKWFDETLQEPLAMALASKFGVSDVPSDAESAKILAVVDAYKAKISALAGGKTAYDPKMCTSIINALDLAPAGDVLAVRFTGRLNKMIQEAQNSAQLIDLL